MYEKVYNIITKGEDMANIIVNKKDDIVVKLVHYFVTEKDYKPIVVNGLQNEIWLENMNNDIKIIRLNINYIHNNEQLSNDLRKVDAIRKNIKKKTYTFKMKVLNILVDCGDSVTLSNTDDIESVEVKRISDIKKNKFVNEYFPDLKDKINSKKSNVVDMFKMTEELNDKTIKEDRKISKLFKNGIPIMTYVLIFINVLVFILMLSPGIYNDFINLFANYYVNVKSGEVYRLVTSMFLHVYSIHLFFNMYSLYVIGPEIERYYGPFKFLIIYLLSGVIGSLFSAVLITSPSIGASGAIFGLFGALLYFGFNYRATLDGYLKGQIIPLILINLLVGLIVPGIDIAAHIGGLIGGLLISLMVGIKGFNKKNHTLHGLLMNIILIASLVYMLMIK